MKNSIIFAISILFLTASVAFAVPANPHVTHILTQPDGTTFEARLIGDERGAWFETLDGYTVIRDSDEWWKFAVKSDEGVEPSAKIVGLSSPKGLPIHASPRPKESSLPGKGAAISSLPAIPAGPARSSLTEGTSKTLVIMMNFTDNPRVNATKYTASWYDNLIFNQSYSLSMYSYYNEVSYGKHNVTGNATVWLTSAHNLSYWGDDSVYMSSTDDVNDCIFNLALEAVNLSDPYINFAQFDSNSDGVIENSELHIIIVHAGQGEESSSVENDIWSHSWTMYGAQFSCVSLCGRNCTTLTLDGKRLTAASSGEDGTVGKYTMLAEDSPMGTFAHEFAHDLGLPDLYNTGTGGEVVGDWDLMDQGSWNGNPAGSSPAHLSAWSKIQLDWLTPITLNGVGRSMYLPQLETNGSAFKLINSQLTSANEYFIVENRQQTGFDSGVPEAGVLIWHIDDDYVSTYWASNAVNNFTTKGVIPEKPGGSLNTAAYSSNDGQTAFNSTTTPNSNTNAGTSNNVSVTVGAEGSSMRVDFFGGDTTAPVVNFTTPSENSGTYVNRAWLRANVTATDDDLVNVTVRLYNSSALVNSTNSSSSPFYLNFTGLSDGIYYINATAYDVANNSNSTETRNVTVDTTFPTITIHSPTNGSVLDSTNVTINVTTSENVVWMNRSIDGNQTTVCTNCNSSVTTSTLTDGTRNITIFASDIAGNVNSTSSIITVDTTPPVVVVYSPLDSTFYNTTQILVNFTATDANAISTLWYYNGTANVTNSTQTVTVADGSHTFIFYGNDTAGYINYTSATFTVDTVAPSVVDNAPISTGYYNTTQTINATATDLYNITFSLHVDASTVNVSSGTTNDSTLTYTLTADGTYSYYALATDIAGNANSTTPVLGIIIDTVQPTVTITSPNASYTNASTASVIGSYNESNVANVTVNGVNATLNASTYNATISLSEGNNSIDVIATDLALNVDTASTWLVKDTTAPTYSAIATNPASPANYSTPIQFNVTWNDTNGISNAQLRFDDGINYNMNVSGSVYTVTVSDRAVGNHSYKFWANDNVGNANETAYTNYTVNPVAPTLTLKINGSAANLTIAYGAIVNVTGSDCPTQLTCTLYRNDAAVANPDYTNSLNYDQNYTYVYNTSGNANYSAATTAIRQVSVQALAASQNATNATTVDVTNSSVTVFVQNANVSTVTIDDSINEDTQIGVSFGPLMNASARTVTLGTSNLTIERPTSDEDIVITILNGTTMTGSSTWDGTFIVPTVQDAEDFDAPELDDGTSAADFVIKIGSSSSSGLNLSQPVKIVLPDMDGKRAAWGTSDNLIDIETECTGANDYSNINTTSPRECYHDSGGDLVIWTYHLTYFAAYTFTEDEEESGGGGGTGGSDNATSNYMTQTWTVINPNGTATMNMSSINSSFLTLTIRVNNTVQNSMAKVIKLSARPQGMASVDAPVYQYLNVTATFSDYITSAEFSFRVERSWLTANNVSAGDVRLARYSNEWQILETEQTSSDANYIYYSSVSPGFSTFAVVALAEEENLTGPDMAPENLTVNETLEITISNQTDGNITLNQTANQTGEAPSVSYPILIIGIALVVISVVGIFVLKRKPKHAYHYKASKHITRNAN